MAVIFPIVSTFDAKGVNQAQKSIGSLGKQANLLKAAFTGVGIGAVAKGLQSSVLAASNLSESIAKSNTVFGKNAQAIQAWSQTTAKSLGVSQQAALEAAGTYGNLFRAFGINEQESARMSQSLVTLAADLASFNNVPIEDALLALRSGLSGETEPLKRFGIALNEARLKEQALAMGLIKTTTGTLPQAIKTQAAYALILKDSALAQGDVARTADGLANQMKFLKAGLEDAKAGFGQVLLPAALSLVNAFNEQLLPAIQRVVEAFQFSAGFGLETLGTEIANVIHNMTGLAKVISQVILALVGMKIASVFIAAMPALIRGVSLAMTALSIVTTYGAAGFKLLATEMRLAMASTGIGLVVTALGFLIGKLIETKIQTEATDKSITFMESNGKTAFRNMGEAAHLANQQIAGNIVTLNAVQLAATRASDALVDNDMKFRKIRSQQGKSTFNPVEVPKEYDPAAAAAAESAAAKAAAGIAKQTAAASKLAADALGKMNDKLTQAREKLQAAKDAYKDFANSVRDSITGLLNFGEAASAETGSFLENLRKQVTGAVSFADKVKQLIKMGLSEAGIQQVLSAGAVAGTKIADELIAGGASAINETNALITSVSSAAQALAKAGADQFYQAGVTQGQAMVNGIIASIKKAGFIISGGMAALPKPLQTAIDNGTLTSSQATQLMGIIGNSQAVTAPANRSGSGATINVTVNAGMGANGTTIGKDIVDAIKKYERTSGPVFKSA